MTARPRKHSVTLRGHRTSISLEDDFWQALHEIAAEKHMTTIALTAEIDASRKGDAGLATAIRLYVLRHFRARLTAPAPPPRHDADS